jgi:signal transduction histidine kinase
MKLLEKQSLKHKILLYTIIVSSLMSTAFTFISLLIDYQIHVGKQEERVESLEKTVLGSLRESLWELNIKQINIQLNDLADVEGIISVELLDDDDKKVFSRKNKVDKLESYFEQYEKSYPIYFFENNEKIYGGRLIFTFSRRIIFMQTLQSALIVFLTQVAKTFFVSFILILIYEKYVTNHLLKISKKIANMNISSTHDVLHFDDVIENSQDEISLLKKQLMNISQRMRILNIENKRLIDQANAKRKEHEIKANTAARLASLGEMAAGIAHEINNPLTIINAQVWTIEKKLERGDEISGDDLKDRTAKIKNGINRISRIIKNMKKVSHKNENEALKVVNIRSFIEDTLEYYQEKFKRDGIDLSFELLKNSYAFVKEVELSQVLMNLLNNAYDAVGDYDEKWVRVIVEQDEETVRIVVRDSGKGISARVLDKIFNPFFTTKDVGKGTGLGLSISKEILQSMEGDLTVNTQAENTEFIICLKKSEASSQRSA